jgi:hypothetical protein
MIKYASSHGLAVLVCSISSALLVETIKPLWPNIFVCFSKASSYLRNFLNLKLTQEEITIMLVAALLAMIWGLIFKMWIKQES